MHREPKLARRLLDRFEPIHGVTYFAPEVREALDGLGYKGYWMGYFAARSAPLRKVPPEVVTAIFYNFAPSRVAKALPAAWEIAGPGEALRVRQDTAVSVLRRYGLSDSDDNVIAAAELLTRVAREAPLSGRPLFAANSALPWPSEPVAALWHATTLLREHRGDTHTAVLSAAGVTGRESNVLHSASGAIPRDYIARTRDYDDEEWGALEQALADRGLLDGGSLTAAGQELKDHIEAQTDSLSLTVLDVLSDDDVETLFRVLTPITRVVVDGGDVPAMTPMALRRDDLDDDSAHLV